MRWTVLYLYLLIFVTLDPATHALVEDEVNGSQVPDGFVFAAVIQDIGWYYTPDHNFTLTRLNTWFYGGAGGNRNVTVSVWTERPAQGGQLLASATYNSSVARGGFGGVALDAPVMMVSGTRYFISFSNVADLGINITTLANNCMIPPGVDHLGSWSRSGSGSPGQFDIIINPGDDGCAFPSFAQPLLQFVGPDPTPTPTPTPIPTPTPVPCNNDLAVPVISGADLPYEAAFSTPANTPQLTVNLGSANQNTPDAFWYFEPTVNGKYQFSLTGYDTYLGLFTGSCCEPVLLRSLDQQYGGEYLVQPLEADKRYLIVAKGDTTSDVGEGRLTIEGPLLAAPNDACEHAVFITPDMLPFRQEVNIANAVDTFDSTESMAQTTQDTPDLWWQFTPAQAGVYEVRATALMFDIILSAYSGSCGSLVELKSQNTPAFYYGEHFTIALTTGTTYTFLVESPATSQEGPVIFDLRGPGLPSPNAICATATVIDPTALPFDSIFDTTFNPNTMDGSESVGFGGGDTPDCWWSFTPNVTGRYAIGVRAVDQIDPTNPDTSLIDESLTIYTGSCGDLTELDSFDEISYGEMAIIELTAGTNYTILTEGFDGITDFGRMRLYVDGPAAPTPNDTCANAIPLNSTDLQKEFIVNTMGNTNTVVQRPDGEKGLDGFIGPDAWYTFTPFSSGTYTIEADLDTGGLASGIDPAIVVYTGDCGSLTEIARGSQGSGISYIPERAVVPMDAGVTYWVAIDSATASGAPVTVRFKGPFFPSFNDLCGLGENRADQWGLFE